MCIVSLSLSLSVFVCVHKYMYVEWYLVTCVCNIKLLEPLRNKSAANIVRLCLITIQSHVTNHFHQPQTFIDQTSKT